MTSNSPTNNINFQTHQSELIKAVALRGYYCDTLNRLDKEKKITWEEKSQKRIHIRNNYQRILNNKNIVIF